MGWILLIAVGLAIYWYIKKQKPDSVSTAGQPMIAPETPQPATVPETPVQDGRRVGILVGDPTATLPTTLGTPGEISFLREAAETSEGESVFDILERAATSWAEGNRIDAIRLCNAMLKKGMPPRPDIWAHHIRSQAIIEHFEGLRGVNDLKQCIAREHVVRDFEAIMGLWAETSETFAEDGRAELENIFEFAARSYSPWTKGIHSYLDNRGTPHRYEPRVPHTWDVDWVIFRSESGGGLENAELCVNGKEYPEFKYRR